MSPPDTSLEQRIGALLKDQPLRRAPETLQARVMEVIAQRRAAPWWQLSFGAWPLAARASFLVISLGLAWLAVAGVMWVGQLVHTTPRPSLLTQTATWAHVAAGLARTAAETGAAILNWIPGWWLDAAAAFGIALYLALFAAGAVAYRAVYSNR
jgi:hypothetical protein